MGGEGYRPVYQIVLREGSSDILFNYALVYSGGPSTGMAGIENNDGSIGLRYSGFDKPGLYTSRSVRFYKDNTPAPVYYDRDGDGYTSDVDCNDYNSTIHPGADELCDGLDNDCDGFVDERCIVDLPSAIDNDGDGYDQEHDCNDFNAAIHPGAAEICGDKLDNDCDGLIDEGCAVTGEGSGGPDAFGYRYITSNDSGGPAYNWEYLSDESQRQLFYADSGLVNAIPMGFFYDSKSEVTPYFEFYGNKYNNVYIAGNGYLTFVPDSKYSNFEYQGQGLPAPDEANNLVAPLWVGGQSPEVAGALVEVIYETLGVEPQRRFVMQFKRNNADGQELAYQVVFYEQENTIQINYKSVVPMGADFQVAGIENSDGSIGLQYADVDASANFAERSVLFYLGDPPAGDPKQSPPPSLAAGGANLFMPLVMAGGWQTSVVLLNDSASETVTGILQGRDAMGEVLVSSEAIVLDPLARQAGTLNDFFGDFDGDLAYLTFTGNLDAVVGSVHLQVDEYGMSGSYPALSHAAAGETLHLPLVMTKNGWINALSLINTDSNSCYATIEFNNGTSKRLFLEPGQQVFFYPLADLSVLAANRQQLALKDTIPEPTNAVISGGKGLVGAALYFQGEMLSAVALAAGAGEEVKYPYVFNNAAWWSGLVIYNPQADPINAALSAFLSDGEAAELNEDDIALGYMQSRTLTPSELQLDSGGWLLAEATSPITGTEFLGTVDGKQMASVSTGGLQGSSGVFSCIHSGVEGAWSGLVLVNPGVVENQVVLAAYDDNGHSLGEARRTIPAHGQVVSEVTTLFEPASIEQATFIRFSAESEIVGILINGRNFNKSESSYSFNALEALPPLRLATTDARY